MLYKYYRYVLIIKIAALIAWGAILWSQRRSPGFEGGTTIVIHSGRQQIDAYSIIQLTDSLPWPYALISSDEQQYYTLHVPRTYDTWYVFQYIRNWLPLVASSESQDRYLEECRAVMHVFGTEKRVKSCQQYGIYGQLRWIVLVIIGVLL